ncbi:MAG: hypothetical protein DI589_21610 [Shinella sp.]|nr:MAG: hypothetical protein DI589_21610 [Shinella sp.]
MSSIKEISFNAAAGHSLTSAPKARSFATPFSAVRASVSGFVRALLNRSNAGGLRELDDHMLDDIGLTRSDVQRAFAVTGRFEDPTPDLARSVRARAWRRFAKTHY